MAKAPSAPRRTTKPTNSTSEAGAPGAVPAAIRMLVGQEGPTLSRVAGQELEVGTEIGADEALRLIDALFAEPA